MVHTILHTAKIFGMECVIFLDAIGGTRCIPEKNGRGAKTAQQEWWGGMRCPGTLGQQGEIQIFLAEAYRCAFETETAKSAGRVRPGSQVNMLFKSL